ncbi:MAG: hypothetical protein ABW149_00025 [Sedimenticola sp.]
MNTETSQMTGRNIAIEWLSTVDESLQNAEKHSEEYQAAIRVMMKDISTRHAPYLSIISSQSFPDEELIRVSEEIRTHLKKRNVTSRIPKSIANRIKVRAAFREFVEELAELEPKVIFDLPDLPKMSPAEKREFQITLDKERPGLRGRLLEVLK